MNIVEADEEQMMAAYGLEAVLVTLFYAAYCLHYHHIGPKVGQAAYLAVVTGIIRSISTLFDAAVIFDISVTVASWNYLRMTDYARIQSTIASMFTTFPVFLTLMMSYGRRQDWVHHEYRIFLVVVFSTVKTGFYGLRWVMIAADKWKERAMPCKPTLPSKHLLGPLVTYTVGWVFVMLTNLFRYRMWVPMSSWSMAPLVVLMWTYVGLFAYNRTASTRISSADSEWGFGQLLAIYTWAMVLLIPINFSTGMY
jgi:hypothetical protein